MSSESNIKDLCAELQSGFSAMDYPDDGQTSNAKHRITGFVQAYKAVQKIDSIIEKETGKKDLFRFADIWEISQNPSLLEQKAVSEITSASVNKKGDVILDAEMLARIKERLEKEILEKEREFSADVPEKSGFPAIVDGEYQNGDKKNSEAQKPEDLEKLYERFKARFLIMDSSVVHEAEAGFRGASAYLAKINKAEKLIDKKFPEISFSSILKKANIQKLIAIRLSQPNMNISAASQNHLDISAEKNSIRSGLTLVPKREMPEKSIRSGMATFENEQESELSGSITNSFIPAAVASASSQVSRKSNISLVQEFSRASGANKPKDPFFEIFFEI
jgi:hypothetical protein